MKIGGLVPFSLNDFPGRMAATVFTQGCNFRCPFCHNGQLLALNAPAALPESDVWRLLEERRGQLDGVVISGGEPTLQPDLPDFLRRARDLGYATKLDTNGSRPEVLRELFLSRLVDFVAMDIKAPLTKYDRLTGTRVPTARLETSIRLIVNAGVEHEFRTTVVESLLSAQDVAAIRKLVPAGSPFTLQKFRPEHALDPTLREAALADEQPALRFAQNS